MKQKVTNETNFEYNLNPKELLYNQSKPNGEDR